MKLPLAILLFAVGSIGLCASPASAIDGPLGCYGGYGYGYLYSNLDYKIPYFAAYPPVYYSYPVPRTYGHSPFAYPPGTRTPDVVAEAPVKPVTILNPYVEQKDGADAKMEDKTTAAAMQPEPLVILNPYVKGSGAFVQVAK